MADTLSVLSWNIGYAGLGADADFVADGGKSLFPRSRQVVRRNLAAVCSLLKNYEVDVYLLQEIARNSKLTRSVDVLSGITGALNNYCWAFSPTISIRRFPFLGNLAIGNLFLSRVKPLSTMRVSLPREKKRWFWIIQQYHNMVVAHFAKSGSSKEWIIFNVHLAAFDKGGHTRHKQLDFIKGYASREFERGNYVIIGGDWNHRLLHTSFPHRTDDKYLTWLQDLPSQFTLDGWKWGLDPTHPTVRTLHKSYSKGDNYTTIIDGFLVSPNVEIEKVETIDLEFRNTDHHPVFMRVSTH